MRIRHLRTVTSLAWRMREEPRRTLVLWLFVILASAGIAGQVTKVSRAGALSFEVASVRPNNSDGVSLAGVQTFPGGSVVGSNVSLRALIYFAYGLKTHETIEGASDLVDRRFDVMARAAANVPIVPRGQVGPLNVMMQTLLAERFKLVVRVEDRPQQGYALVRARADGPLGQGLRPVAKCGTATSSAGARADCAIRVIQNEMRGNGQSMERIAGMLSTSLGRPVVDRTGIAGSFDVRMTFDHRALREFAGWPVSSDGRPSNLPSLFTALEEQIGLKLEPQRVPARAFIVEHVEPPSEN
jgi:uncharacterized protein (TIGR03435 family)